VTRSVFLCPNPNCREEVAPSDQYCEGCGQAIPRARQAPSGQSADGSAGPAVAANAPSPNGRSQDRETRGASRARDHVELSLPGVAAVSDRGLERARNEDAVRLGQVADPDTTILVVCDGVSSSQFPARASQAAADAAIASLTMTLEAEDRGLELAMKEAIAAAWAAVAAIPHQPWGGKDPPSSTLVAAAIANGHVTVGWVGDSRAYFVGPVGTWQLSSDDTWAAEQVALGRLSEREAARDPRGKFLTRWLGRDQEDPMASSVRTFEIEWPGIVLLCSDGLWNYVDTADTLGEMVLGLGEDVAPLTMARALTDFARDAGGHDNITVAVAVPIGRRGS
jgi:PPM family protein phosphatase